MFVKCTLLAILFVHTCQALTNGLEVLPHQYPYQVALYAKLPILGKEHFTCGGVILRENWILTSARCIPKWKSLIVKAGKHQLSSSEDHEQVRSVKFSVKHNKYSGSSWLLKSKIPQHDIALLKLFKPLVLNDYVQAIALPELGANFTGIGTLTGWGGVADQGISNVLQVVRQPFINVEACTKAIRKLHPRETIKENQICTDASPENTSACSLDLGGPVIQHNINAVPQLVGIASWVHSPCGVRGMPTVHTKVSSYIDWISKKINK